MISWLFCFICFISSMSFRGFNMYTQRIFLHFDKSIIFQLSIIVSLNIKLVNELHCFRKISVFTYVTLNLKTWLHCVFHSPLFRLPYMRNFETLDNLLILLLLQCLWKWLFDFEEIALSWVLPLISNRKTNNVFACQVISFQFLTKK